MCPLFQSAWTQLMHGNQSGCSSLASYVLTRLTNHTNTPVSLLSLHMHHWYQPVRILHCPFHSRTKSIGPRPHSIWAMWWPAQHTHPCSAKPVTQLCVGVRVCLCVFESGWSATRTPHSTPHATTQQPFTKLVCFRRVEQETHGPWRCSDMMTCTGSNYLKCIWLKTQMPAM